MIMKKLFQATAIGLSLCIGTFATTVSAEILQIVRNGGESSIDVPMNRAIVVESDIPFAELSIANPSIADFSTLSDRTVYVLGKTPGQTTLTLLDAQGRLISNVNVIVTPEISEFKLRLRQILPNEKIEVRTANDGVVLSGTVSSTNALDQALSLAERYSAGKVSNLLTVGGVQQVMLRVRFAEMQRTIAKSLSSSVALQGNLLNNELGLNAGTGAGTTTAGQGGLLSGNSDGAGASNGTAVLGFNAGALEVAVMLEALETKGFVRTLAEPNLTALSGKPASFLAGGEYPIPVLQDGAVSIEFKPFGVNMEFTPTVLQNDTINLELSAEVSSLDSSASVSTGSYTVSGTKTRKTSTTVELRDGESFAIAGLLQDDFQDLNGQVPWLGDVPILGALFRSADYSRKQSELVIIVTAHLVTPVKGEAFQLPTDRIRPPSEKDLFLFGRTTAPSNNKGAGEVAQQDFNSSYGYVME